MDPRSIRTNNPGAMNWGPFAQKWGATTSDGRLAVFPDMDTGYAAMGKLLDVYRDQHGLNTVSGIINRWAPRNADNNSTDAYIATVAKGLGIDPNAPLTPDHRPGLMQAMASYEAGRRMPGPTVAPTSVNFFSQATQPAPAEPPMDINSQPLTREQLIAKLQGTRLFPQPFTPPVPGIDELGQPRRASPLPSPAISEQSAPSGQQLPFPQILQSALETADAPPPIPQQQPQPASRTSAMAPQPPATPVAELPQQPNSFVDRLSAALNAPMTQQGLGLFLAASQGKDLNSGLTAGMERARAAQQHQAAQREMQLKEARETIWNNMMRGQNPPWAQNLPPGFADILRLAGPDAGFNLAGQMLLKHPELELARQKMAADIALARKKEQSENFSPVPENSAGFLNKSTGEFTPFDNGTNPEFKKAASQHQAELFKEYVKDGDLKANFGADLNRLRQLSAAIGNPGKWAELKATLGPWAQTVGVNVDGLDDIQAFQAIVARLAPNMRPAGSGATSDYEQRLYLSALPQLVQSPESRAKTMQALQSMADFSVERARIARDAFTRKIPLREAEDKLQALTDKHKAIEAPAMAMAKQIAAPKEEAAQAPDTAASPVVKKLTQDMDAAPPGTRRQVQGKTYQKAPDGSWDEVREKTPMTFGNAVQSPDMWRAAMKGIPPLNIFAGR